MAEFIIGKGLAAKSGAGAIIPGFGREAASTRSLDAARQSIYLVTFACKKCDLNEGVFVTALSNFDQDQQGGGIIENIKKALGLIRTILQNGNVSIEGPAWIPGAFLFVLNRELLEAARKYSPQGSPLWWNLIGTLQFDQAQVWEAAFELANIASKTEGVDQIAERLQMLQSLLHPVPIL